MSDVASPSDDTRALGIASSHEDAGLELRVLAQSLSVDHFALRWPDALAKSLRVLELAALGSTSSTGKGAAKARMHTP